MHFQVQRVMAILFHQQAKLPLPGRFSFFTPVCVNSRDCCKVAYNVMHHFSESFVMLLSETRAAAKVSGTVAGSGTVYLRELMQF